MEKCAYADIEGPDQPAHLGPGQVLHCLIIELLDTVVYINV